ncbi:MAG: aspartate aminotransferase family protein [Chloroflexi bacterium]|nr:aspartate aminotransferase family protein [Chloroflexota bacterium]
MTVTPEAARHLSLAPTHLSPVLARYFERTWSHGEGHRLFDSDGKAYLDFACGIAVTILGHRHPDVTAAIHAQADRLLHTCNGLGYLEPVTALADALARMLPEPLDAVFLANSGTEAIEGAMKLARRASARPGIVAFSGAFHGRTYGSLSATTSNPNYQRDHGPLLPSVLISPFPDIYRLGEGDEDQATTLALEALDRLLDEAGAESVAALLIEPVQGEGGYNPSPTAFLRAIRERCDRHGILLIADEIQSGYGRTGRMWAFEAAGIVPDVVTLAKGMANGLPLGAIVSSRELQARWGVGAHGSTFGGNPVCCAAAVAVLETIESEGLVGNAAARGAELSAGLHGLMARDERIGDIRGPGLMIGLELVRDRETREPDAELATALMARCADLGLLLLTCGTAHNVIRWIPPLDVTAAEVTEALAIFEEALGAG